MIIPRTILAAPLIIVGEIVTTIGYRVAGAAHLNPHTRSPRASTADRRTS